MSNSNFTFDLNFAFGNAGLFAPVQQGGNNPPPPSTQYLLELSSSSNVFNLLSGSGLALL